MSRILIVEDEPIIAQALKRFLQKHDYQVELAASIDQAENYNFADFNLIISDLRLPGGTGTDLIGKTDRPVLIMTSYASMKSAVDAMKLGAADYIAKPFDHDEMLSTVRQILERTAQPAAVEPTQAAEPTKPTNQFIGRCAAMQTLFSRIEKVAKTDATVLVLGESGTGKELAARAIHDQSARAGAPMISVNCAAIPDTLIESELFGHEKGAFTGANSNRNGLIEAADGGTLFLDEIGELPLEAQARLLRFLQEGEIRKVGAVESKQVDVRLIAATHRNLKELAKSHDFREDLYYRLYVMELRMPPLRERREDIIPLAETFLSRACDRLNITMAAFSSDAHNTLTRYTWPGNVRELENAIERAAILTENGLITTELLGLDLEHGGLNDVEIQYIERKVKPKPKTAAKASELSLDDYFQRFVLEHQEQLNETELAKRLGISRKCLWERRQRLGIPRRPKKQA